MTDQAASRHATICNCICVILSLLLLILQFSPFWQTEEGAVSIQGYIWFPSSHTELQGVLREATGNGDFSVNDILTMPILVLLTGVAGMVIGLWKRQKPLALLLPTFCGLVGVWGYLVTPVMRLGANWGLHLAVCVAMAVVGAVGLLTLRKKPEDTAAAPQAA